jgi:putative ABC transport system permease protein
MKNSVLISTAWSALRRNVSRSILTMLGIIIGVAAVICSTAVGAGSQAAVLKQIESLGSNLIIITPGAINAGGVSLGTGSRTTLSLSDITAITTNVPHVAAVAPYSQLGATQVIANGLNWSTTIGGTTTAWPIVGNWIIAKGSFFSEEDVRKVTKVAVLGSTVAANLFASGNAVGSTVNIRSVPFKVVGVLVPKGQTGIGRDQDDVVIVPISTHEERLTGQHYIGTIMISAASAGTVSEVIDETERLLRISHKLDPVDPDDFTIRNVASVQAVREATSATQAILLAAVAIVSLVVGGIGIMNIMLVSVTERTREIGLRMAVGAHSRDILLQFVIEALTMACAGGLIGVGFGAGISYLVSSVAHWQTVITALSIILGFVSALVTGVVFGFYPAHRAASLSPIDALRYE